MEKAEEDLVVMALQCQRAKHIRERPMIRQLGLC